MQRTGLVLIRIDDRLIHGQVIQAWVRHTRADCIVVASDLVSDDPLQKSIMEIAAPPPLKVEILKVREATAKILEGHFKNFKTIILFSNPQDLLRAMEWGLEPKKVNVGVLHYLEGRRLLTSEVALNKKEIKAFRLLMQKGVSLELQAVPSDRGQNLKLLIS
jgi:mannose/fructose/N-acetylgalactosamine-specific phosphotransferase system component IIB